MNALHASKNDASHTGSSIGSNSHQEASVPPALKILVVDDEPSIRLSLGDALERAGYVVERASNGEEALSILADHAFDLVVTDISMPKVDGIALFHRIQAEYRSTRVLLMTAFGKLSDAVAALKRGAIDYVQKPFEIDEMLVRIERINERNTLERSLAHARAQLVTQSDARLVGQSQVMKRVIERVDTIAQSSAPVLILGESGTGKELIARRLHQMSARANKPFVAVSCAAFPETLIEAELFGHEKGAFTGATQKRVGRFLAANGGTLFLDEVAEISPAVQAKLLRVLQQSEFEPIGSNQSIKVDVRIVSATHQKLRQRISDGLFREDLYYRLNAIDVQLPPLRERRDDIPILVEHFIKRASERGTPSPTGFSPEAFAVMMQYPFPGNVRELEHAVLHALVLARGGEVLLEHLPSDLVGAVRGDRNVRVEEALRPLSDAAKAFERTYLLRALTAADGVKSKAAELLHISRKNLWEKLKAHGISDDEAE